MSEDIIWSVMLDWGRIVSLLGLESISEIPDLKIRKALKTINKEYDPNILLSFVPSKLDDLVAKELSVLMKKELALKAKREERMQKDKDFIVLGGHHHDKGKVSNKNGYVGSRASPERVFVYDIDERTNKIKEVIVYEIVEVGAEYRDAA